MHDAVRIHVKRHINLWNTSGCRRNADELKLSEKFVVGNHLSFALEDLDPHLGLHVSGSREGLGLLGRHSGVTGIITVITPPNVSIPIDRGVTSSSKRSPRSPHSTPPWMAAPMATTSSGLTPRDGSLPKMPLTISCTFGTRVMPPTRTMSLISARDTPASLRQF